MTLGRHNILQLIGKNRYKYSSCILTCFTFDFTFFEEKVLNVLRQANILNVNVFLDGHHLDHVLEKNAGTEYQSTNTYSLNKVYETGVFHPKIMLLMGPKHGLLIVGSGNLTSSGLNTNDEIWGAFHLDTLESPNAPLFASAWKYVSQYFDNVFAFNREKISWMYKRSPWLKELEQLVPSSFVTINKHLEIQFVGNMKEASLYKQIDEILPKTKIKKLTIVSPYFDEQGKFLEQINSDYTIENIECITDTEFGILPHKLKDELQNKINFYEWGACVNEFNKEYNRLHAKMFQFEYEEGYTYLIMGSPNATSHAFGGLTNQAKNAEAGLVIRGKNKISFLKELGVSTKGVKSFSLPTSKKEKTNSADSTKRIKTEAKIIYAELNGSKLIVYLNQEILSEAILIIEDDFGFEVEQHLTSTNQTILKIEIKDVNKIYKIHLSRDGHRISNFSLIHNVAILAKCNPDPNQAELNEIIERLSNNPEQDHYIELLKYADYNWVDEEIDNPSSSNNGGAISLRRSNKEEASLYTEITEDEFNQLNSVQSKEAELLNNTSVQIADILNLLSKGLTSDKSESEENEEEAQTQSDGEEQNGQGKEIKQNAINKTRGYEEACAINNHLEKVHTHFKHKVATILSSENLKDAPQTPIILRDLSNISICVDLIYMFLGQTYTEKFTEFSVILKKENEGIIKAIEKKYALIRDVKKNYKKNYKKAYYLVEASLFASMKEELTALDSEILDKQNIYSHQTFESPYFPIGAYDKANEIGVKWALIGILGKFIICSNSKAGFKEYEYELLNDKMKQYRTQIVEKAIFLILNLQWSKSETEYVRLLLLDLLDFVSPQSWIAQSPKIIKQLIKSYRDRANYHCPAFDKNLKEFSSDLLVPYQPWKQKFEKWQKNFPIHKNPNPLAKMVNTLQGEYVYNSYFGFAKLVGANDFGQIFMKAGFDWDSDKGAAILEIRPARKMLIAFKTGFKHPL